MPNMDKKSNSALQGYNNYFKCYIKGGGYNHDNVAARKEKSDEVMLINNFIKMTRISNDHKRC